MGQISTAQTIPPSEPFENDLWAYSANIRGKIVPRFIIQPTKSLLDLLDEHALERRCVVLCIDLKLGVAFCARQMCCFQPRSELLFIYLTFLSLCKL